MQKSVGRTVLVQLDTRFCAGRRDWMATMAGLRAAWFWWKAVHINGLWADRHGYDHLCVCIRRCSQPCGGNSSSPRRKVSWCKLKVVAELLLAGMHDTVLLLDSDAYIISPSLSLPDVLRGYTWPDEWVTANRTASTQPSVFFACNEPFSEGWPQAPRPDSTLAPPLERQLLQRGPPNSGFWLAKNTPSALRLLRTWWAAHPDAAWVPRRAWPWHKRWQEQAALWDLFLAHGENISAMGPFVATARVLASPHVRQIGRGACLRAMGRPGGSSVPVLVGGDRHDMMPPLVRHLDHHHYKWASTKAVVMDADLQTAAAAAAAHSTSRSDRTPGTVGRCRTRLVELSPSVESLERGDGSNRCAEVQGADDSSVRTGLGREPRYERAADGHADGSMASILARAVCADALTRAVPPCSRAVKPAECEVSFSASEAVELNRRTAAAAATASAAAAAMLVAVTDRRRGKGKGHSATVGRRLLGIERITERTERNLRLRTERKGWQPTGGRRARTLDLGLAVCITGQLARLELHSKVSSLLEPLSRTMPIVIFVVVEQGPMRFSNNRSSSQHPGCAAEPTKAMIAEALGGLPSEVHITPHADHVVNLTLWPRYRQPRVPNEGDRSVRLANHIAQFGHSYRCAALVEAHERRAGGAFSALLKLRDNSLVVPPGLNRSLLTLPGVHVKLCPKAAGQGRNPRVGINDKVLLASRSHWWDALRAPYELMTSVCVGRRPAHWIDSEEVHGAALRRHVARITGHPPSALSFVDGRCMRTDHKGNKRWCVLPTCKDCWPTRTLPWPTCGSSAELCPWTVYRPQLTAKLSHSSGSSLPVPILSGRAQASSST